MKDEVGFSLLLQAFDQAYFDTASMVTTAHNYLHKCQEINA